jgi:hypothetical protein
LEGSGDFEGNGVLGGSPALPSGFPPIEIVFFPIDPPERAPFPEGDPFPAEEEAPRSEGPGSDEAEGGT